MWVVRAEQHPVGAVQIAEHREIVLVVGRDPHVFAQLLGWVGLERGGPLRVRLLEVGVQVGHPRRAGLDRGDTQAQVAREHATAYQRADRVVDRAMTSKQTRERVVTKRLHLAAHAPVGRITVVAHVARVVRDDDARFGGTRPEAVVHRVGRRAREVGAAHRTGSHHHDLGAVREHPLDFPFGLLRVGEREIRRGVEPLLVVERPVVVHPLVERVERDVRGIGIVHERLLHADAERREEEGRLDVLLVELRDTRRGIAIAGIDRFEITEHGADVVAGALAAEVLVEPRPAAPRDRTTGSG